MRNTRLPIEAGGTSRRTPAGPLVLLSHTGKEQTTVRPPFPNKQNETKTHHPAPPALLWGSKQTACENIFSTFPSKDSSFYPHLAFSSICNLNFKWRLHLLHNLKKKQTRHTIFSIHKSSMASELSDSYHNQNKEVCFWQLDTQVLVWCQPWSRENQRPIRASQIRFLL